MPEVITRRNLPHWYRTGASFFVTYRLRDTLPQAALEELKHKRERWLTEIVPNETPHERRHRAHRQWFATYDQFLDASFDRAWLREPTIAALIRGNLYHHHGTKYHLLAYCIMPNHVHLVLQPFEMLPEPIEEQCVGDRPDGASPLSKIMHSLKSYTAHEANKRLHREGSFWQRESYDHWIRDEDELARVIQYIQANPVKAGLTTRPEEWYWCSCHDRYLQDGQVSAWLI